MREFFAIAVAAVASATWADVIDVAPGAGTITAAVAKARSGDTLKLAPGEFTDSTEVPEGVSVEGAGADKTTVSATGYAAINCRGPNVRVAGITIKPGEKTIRGINTSTSLRVERCRFVGVKEGVAMMGAPLSDVVACDFIDCGIGVRAIGGACPTVWGCLFQGGGMGVFSMDGAPYVRNNVFTGQRAGMRLSLADGAEQPIIRNNLFTNCKDAGVELMARGNPILGPSIRNNIFDCSGAAVTGEGPLLGATSHCLVHEVPEPPFRDKAGGEAAKLGENSLSKGDVGAKVTDGTCTETHPELVDAKGIRTGGEPGAHGRIGPEAAWLTVGVRSVAPLPPIRWEPPTLIANAVAEEYQVLRQQGLAMGEQSTGTQNGKQIDRMKAAKAGKPVELVFDISRFYDEMSMKP